MSSQRLQTKEVRIGKVLLGNALPIVPQTMTTTDTMETEATVQQSIECIQAGAELVRITAPSKKEAQNLAQIKSTLLGLGYDTPIVADIHYTPNAAEIAAQYVEKVRINPGNYVDKKKFEYKEYTDETYQQEIERIREKFVQLLEICTVHGTAIRIGTNHGSLSDRIMSRYGDTPEGMVESAMEFLRIARSVDFHQIVLSMKSSNPLVMVKAYRTLVAQMIEEFGECYPLHLGVTEAGDGEDGRVKSALGIGTLLEDGLGDTIRVSLTEDPQLEIPVCNAIIERYTHGHDTMPDYISSTYLSPPIYKSSPVYNIGGDNPSVVCARVDRLSSPKDLEDLGYVYDESLDKWHSRDQAVDILISQELPELQTYPEGLIIASSVSKPKLSSRYLRLVDIEDCTSLSTENYLVQTDMDTLLIELAKKQIVDWLQTENAVLLVNRQNSSLNKLRELRSLLIQNNISVPILWQNESKASGDKEIIEHTVAVGSPFIEQVGDGVELLGNESGLISLSFSILQATRTRISKTEYISCPSCGRTLFDLQDTTALIRNATQHLKGVKIAIMGCIVNGPGEMADADFGYVGAGPNKISLYKGQDCVRRNIPTEEAVEALIDLLKEHDAWQEPML